MNLEYRNVTYFLHCRVHPNPTHPYRSLSLYLNTLTLTPTLPNKYGDHDMDNKFLKVKILSNKPLIPLLYWFIIES